MIDHGKIIWDGRIEELKKRFGGQRTLTVDLHFEPKSFTPPPGTTVLAEDGPRKWLSFHQNDVSAVEVIKDLVDRYQVRDLSVRETDIEEIVRNIYQNDGLPSSSPDEMA